MVLWESILKIMEVKVMNATEKKELMGKYAKKLENAIKREVSFVTFAGMLIRKYVYFSCCKRCVMIDLLTFFCYNITSIFILYQFNQISNKTNNTNNKSIPECEFKNSNIAFTIFYSF